MSQLLLVQGTALHLPLKDASVHTCVTSPPYYGLRSYGIGEGELGLERTLEAYVEAMVQVFREVKRVLRPDATLWLNLGDVYNSARGGAPGNLPAHTPIYQRGEIVFRGAASGLPEKSLLGLPWRLAFALQADGWTLRSDIIWDKPSCMPESVQDRPTRSHEYVFLFSKQARYFYDAEAVREPMAEASAARYAYAFGGDKAHALLIANADGPGSRTHPIGYRETDNRRNARTVWRIPSEPFSGSHFATFPTALVRRCLLAGAPTQVCAACGKAWRREVEQHAQPPSYRPTNNPIRYLAASAAGQGTNGTGESTLGMVTASHTLGFTPTCACAASVAPSVVLDCFAGSGTTLLVARELGHHAIGIDLSYPYLSTIARERLGFADLARWEGRNGHHTPAVTYDGLPLFAGSA